MERIDYCPECNSTKVDYMDDMNYVSTFYICENGHTFDYYEAKHEFVEK